MSISFSHPTKGYLREYRTKDLEHDRRADRHRQQRLREVGNMLGGNERHTQGDTGLRNKGETEPTPIQDRRSRQDAPDPSAKYARQRAQHKVGNADGADLVEARQIQRRAGQDKKQHHERPFDVLDLMKWSRMVLGEIDDQRASRHSGEQERDFELDRKPCTQEHNTERLGLYRFAGVQPAC